jgi:hypothetical protein
VKKPSNVKPTRLPAARVLAAALLAATIGGGAALSADLPGSNASERDKSAFHFRQLQVELMVAALSCGRADLQSDYNSFVAKFSHTLKTNGQRLKSYFSRAYGARGTQEMDSFLTKLSNELSLVSMRDASFCERSGSLFQAVMTVPTTEIESFANRHLTEQVAARRGT